MLHSFELTLCNVVCLTKVTSSSLYVADFTSASKEPVSFVFVVVMEPVCSFESSVITYTSHGFRSQNTTTEMFKP